MPPPSDFRARLAARGATVRDVAALLRRRWWVVVACVLLIPGGVYAYSARQAKTYQASVVLQPEPSPLAISGSAASSAQSVTAVLEGYAGLGQVASATARILHRPYSAVGELDASSSPETGWLTLTVTAATPRQAVDSANAYATALTTYVRHDARLQLEKQIVGVRQSLAVTRDPVQRRDTRDQLAALTALRDATTRPVRVVAATNASVASPHPSRNAILALILAVLIAPALVVMVDRLDRKVRRPTDLERLSGVPLLASIPKEAFTRPAGPRADRVFQRLRDSLIFFDPDRRPTSIAIVSPLAGEGRTTVATGLAVAFARAGRRVALVDADLRDPGVAGRMGMLAAPGLSDVIAGHDLDGALRRVEGFEGELAVLPAGSPSPQAAELLGSDEMSRLLAWLSEQFDFVVVDTAPLLVTSGAVGLVSRASGVLVLARLNHTPRDAVRRMIRMAAAADGRVLGVVATDARVERRIFELVGEQKDDPSRAQPAAV
jgi:polysaccharide biosynthesis transport protein